MRKITRNAVEAFYMGQDFNQGNTAVRNDNGVPTMYLHGNAIAKVENGLLFVRTCGWGTHTTRERLSGLQGVQVSQKNFEQYLNGKLWDNHAQWTLVS